jgi:hypothetical protein
MLSLLTAVAFATYSVYGLGMCYAEQKAAVIEVKPGVLTGKIMDLDEKPMEGKSVKILDAMGKVKYAAATDKEGMYKIENLAAGTYTMIVAGVQKVSLVVKSDSNNTVVNAMVPMTTGPYNAGAEGGLSVPVIIAITGGVLLLGFGIYKIVDHGGDTKYVPIPVSP